jgi:hypothetical protein
MLNHIYAQTSLNPRASSVNYNNVHTLTRFFLILWKLNEIIT